MDSLIQEGKRTKENFHSCFFGISKNIDLKIFTAVQLWEEMDLDVVN